MSNVEAAGVTEEVTSNIEVGCTKFCQMKLGTPKIYRFLFSESKYAIILAKKFTSPYQPADL